MHLRFRTLFLVGIVGLIAVAHGNFCSGAERSATSELPTEHSAEFAKQLASDAMTSGDALRGADVFRAAQFACVSCHRVVEQGGSVGPRLDDKARCRSAEFLAESLLWPQHHVEPEYRAIAVRTSDGTTLQGYKRSESDTEIVMLDAGAGEERTIAREDIDEVRDVGSLMPAGLAAAMTPAQRRDVLRFLIDLQAESDVGRFLVHDPKPIEFTYDLEPLDGESWPHRVAHVNRERVYDFYAKEAEFFRGRAEPHQLLPEFPGLDQGVLGHWGNQNEATWASNRWNSSDLGTVLAGVFRAGPLTVPRGVCVRLGDAGEMAACFNPDTLCFEAVWQGGFVKTSSVRHGFIEGLQPVGTMLERPAGSKPSEPFAYNGFYRHGKRVVFSYRIGNVEMLDAPWCEDGQFVREVGPAEQHSLAKLTRGGPQQWPQELVTRGKLGSEEPYAIDTISIPTENPWKALFFVGDLDFFADGTALVCTMQGDVWHVRGLDETLEHVTWKRFASGLHHALGLVIADGKIYVQGRDQITELQDLNADGEADYYRCFSNAFTTSPAGHDYICGLHRDEAGNFYTASGNEGLLRISADGKKSEVLATGFRNPDGLGLLKDGSITIPCSEGEWTPASMLCEIRTGGHYGYNGPKNGEVPDLPLVYLARGLDNSSGGQVQVTSDRWGPLKDQLLHFSFGTCTHFLILRDKMDGQPQGAVVPLKGDFASSIHRGRFNPKDGQLYVGGMAGWGSYATSDGCFQRVRYTGKPVQLPSGFHVYENGVSITFTEPVDRAVAEDVKNQFAQCWNYRYSSAYGSPEFSPRHSDTPGHDPVRIRSATVLDDNRTVFLEMPDLQPVNQLHLRLRVDHRPAQDVFVTVHKLDKPFTELPGYVPTEKTIAAHPMLVDLQRTVEKEPNPWREELQGARDVEIAAGKNLTFATRTFTVRAGETIRLSLQNPDVVPHNWALIKPGRLNEVGHLVNLSVADPQAAARQYVPRTDDVIAYTDVTEPTKRSTIYFRAPMEKGVYPYLCTFPGHWMVMNGEMIVE